MDDRVFSELGTQEKEKEKKEKKSLLQKWQLSLYYIHLWSLIGTVSTNPNNANSIPAVGM